MSLPTSLQELNGETGMKQEMKPGEDISRHGGDSGKRMIAEVLGSPEWQVGVEGK